MKYDLNTRQAKLENEKVIHHITAWFLDNFDSYNNEPITPEERKEIAEYMIEMWKEWAK